MTVAEAQLWGSILAFVGTVLTAVYVARKGKQSTEQSTQVGFIQQLLGRVATLESQVTELWQLREKDAQVKRAQGDHIDVLENHIWQRKPPPPPPRPTGI